MRTYNPAQPVVCLDEKPISLDDDVRPLIPAKPGKPAKQDNEYGRCGFGVAGISQIQTTANPPPTLSY